MQGPLRILLSFGWYLQSCCRCTDATISYAAQESQVAHQCCVLVQHTLQFGAQRDDLMLLLKSSPVNELLARTPLQSAHHRHATTNNCLSLATFPASQRHCIRPRHLFSHAGARCIAVALQFLNLLEHLSWSVNALPGHSACKRSPEQATGAQACAHLFSCRCSQSCPMACSPCNAHCHCKLTPNTRSHPLQKTSASAA